jgi:beta-alanine--pyruvate transaminase
MEAHWMPFTANRAFKAAPRLLAASKGMYYTDVDGNQILDGTAGLWCVNAGHSREPIVQAIAEAAATLDYAPGFNIGHPLSFALANRLVEIMPKPLDHVFFANSGSEAVDTALKMAMAYWIAKGQPQRVRFVGRLRGYHGVGFGGISVGGIAKNREAYMSQLMPHVSHLPATHGIPENFFSRGQPEHGANLADALEGIVSQFGADTIAAVIVEPVAGSTGVLVPPVGYLDRLRAICDKHGILLIFDEVITGFGRMGTPFAADRFGVVPDMMTVAKGITNGSVPMGAVFARDAIYSAVLDAAESGIEFFHGYTYSGHPLACAAGLATLDLYRDEGLFDRARDIAPYWEKALHSLKGTPNVIDIRNMGLVGGVEIESRPGKVGARGLETHIDCFKHGVLTRFTADTIAMSPPLIVETHQIDRIIDTLGSAIKRLA